MTTYDHSKSITTTNEPSSLELARVGEVGTESNGFGSGLDLERLLLGKSKLLCDFVRKFLVDVGAERERGDLSQQRVVSE